MVGDNGGSPLIKKEVVIITCCDTDPTLVLNQKRIDYDKKEQIWSGVTEGIPKLKEIFDSLGGKYDDQYPKITWLLRSDEQMKVFYDDYAYPVKRFESLWKSCKRQGDEIGWHPHLWDWNDKINCWYPQLENLKWVNKCLDNGYKNFIKHFSPTSVRTGWNFQSNFVMKKLNDIGITVDLSAIPGEVSISSKFGPHPPAYINWDTTKEENYYPSVNDYRRPAKKDEDSLEILEMPISSAPISFFWSVNVYLYNKIFLYLKYRYGKSNFKRHMDMRPTKHPRFFIPGIKRKFKESRDKEHPVYLISYFHPDELLNKTGLFSITNFESNLKSIFEISERYRVSFRFLTATKAAEEYNFMKFTA